MSDIGLSVKTERWHDVIKETDALLAADKADAKILFYRALAAYKLDDFKSSYDYAIAAFEADPSIKELAHFLAALSIMVGKTRESYFYGKVAYTCVPNADIEKNLPDGIIPDYTDTLGTITETPLIARGLAAFKEKDMEMAEHWFGQHVLFYPKDINGQHILADCHISEERILGASQSLKAAIHSNPDDASLHARLGGVLCQLGEFDAGRGCLAHSLYLDPSNTFASLQQLIAFLHDIGSTKEDYIQAAKNWAHKFSISDLSGGCPAPQDHAKLTVGWILSGSDRLRFAPALAQTLAKRNQDRFTFVGFGEGDLLDDTNSVYRKCFDDWRTVNFDDPFTLSDSLQAFGVDIIINCGGLRASELLHIFGSRIAPVQMTLGTAPLAGYKHLDYQATSSVIVPEDQKLSLPSGATFLITERGDDLDVYGLPAKTDGTFTFGSDATFADLTPKTVELWARILKRAPNAKLILRNHDFEVPSNTERLINIFGFYGLSHRIDILATATSREFLEQVDTYLLPLRNANSAMIGDVLSAGVPMVAHSQHDEIHGYAHDLIQNSRYSKQILMPDDATYVEKAISWVKSEERSDQLRMEMARDFITGPQFNAGQRIKELEQCMEDLWSKACANE